MARLPRRARADLGRMIRRKRDRMETEFEVKKRSMRELSA
jgi:hypothetical protein